MYTFSWIVRENHLYYIKNLNPQCQLKTHSKNLTFAAA